MNEEMELRYFPCVNTELTQKEHSLKAQDDSWTEGRGLGFSLDSAKSGPGFGASFNLLVSEVERWGVCSLHSLWL